MAADRDSAFACSPTLHTMLTNRAQAERTPINALTEQLLQSALDALPQQLLSPTAYLADKRIAERADPRLTIRLARAVMNRASEVASHWSATLGKSVARGSVIKALLWQTLVPRDLADQQINPTPATDQGRASLTVSISTKLNIELRDVAENQSLTREKLVEQLLSAQLEAVLAAHQSKGSLEAFAQPYIHARDTITTIRIPRELDSRFREEEIAWRNAGIPLRKGEIIEVLLWRALEMHEKPSSETASSSDLLITVRGDLAVRVRQQLQHERRTREATVTLRTLVEHYIEEGVARDERRRTRNTTTVTEK